MEVPYIDLGIQHKKIKDEIIFELEKVLLSGQFILGKSVEEFENSFAELCDTKFALGTANGTDALVLSMKALGIGDGDEVITAPNSFLASASSIAICGATPVFADVCDDLNIDPEKIEKAVTPKTKAVIPVHLTGRPANMDSIIAIAQKFNLFIIEDAAQAIGAEYKNKKVGSFGITGCFSFHPLKNLSACGDGGIITTSKEEIFWKLLKLRNHGLKNRNECEFWSLNSRLDALQVAILKVKLQYLNIWTKRRRFIASLYQDKLGKFLKVPMDKYYEKSVYHTFIVQSENRDKLQEYLFQKGIETKIHYPIPIHLQEAAKNLGYKKGDFPITEILAENILSLPIYPELTDEQINYVITTISEFFTHYLKKYAN